MSFVQDEVLTEAIQYKISRLGSVGYEDYQLSPLVALHAVVFQQALMNFGDLLQSSSFRNMCHSTINNDTISAYGLDMENAKKDIASEFLHFILNEIERIPSDFFFYHTRKGRIHRICDETIRL